MPGMDLHTLFIRTELDVTCSLFHDILGHLMKPTHYAPKVWAVNYKTGCNFRYIRIRTREVEG
jgi:hypothetical protein